MSSSKNTSNSRTVVVVGATGATGHKVVQFLLDQGVYVKTIVRSKEKMESLLSKDSIDRLDVKEGNLLNMSDDEIKEFITPNCHAILSCLGHNLTFGGIWGEPKQLVTDSVTRLSQMAGPSTRVILMNSNGVANPSGEDRPRTKPEATIIWLLRHLIPPHADNEKAAEYLYKEHNGFVAVRPGDLTDADEVTPYETMETAPRGPFEGDSTSRINVADFMAKLAYDDKLFEQWKNKMPVIFDDKKKDEPEKQ